MLDVHPPHAPVHGWRDFAVHLLTITAGLLIALGLEAAVEAAHHHELAAQARENIEQELAKNAGYAKDNVAKVQIALAAMDANLAAARVSRDHQSHSIKVRVDAAWTNFEDAAWLTARESGALAHMPLDEVQKYAGVYAHQEVLEREANAIRDSALQTMAPLMIEDSPEHASPEDWRLMMLRSADTKMQLTALKQLVAGLSEDYAEALGTGSPVAPAAQASGNAPAAPASTASAAVARASDAAPAAASRPASR